MATYLEMCQEVHRTIRAGNGAPGSAPTAVTARTGLEDEIVRWVKRAWIDIQQSRREWLFLHKQITATLASASSAITAANLDANYAWLLPFASGAQAPHILIYPTADGVGFEGQCRYVPYEVWRGTFDIGIRGASKPSQFTIMPDRSLQFDCPADQSYTIRADIRLDAQELAADGDTPLNYPSTGTGLLPEYHDVIVWRAVQYYCMSREGADKLLIMAKEEYRKRFSAMCRDYLPETRLILGYQ